MADLTFVTYVGNREDLLDVISNIAPTETPMFSTFGKVQVTNTLVQWQTDSDTNVSSYTPKAIGFEKSVSDVAATTLKTNYTEIFYESFNVADTQQAISHAGRASEIAYQKEKIMRKIANDVEYEIVTNGAATAPSSGVPGVTAGLASGGLLTGNYTYDAGANPILKTVSAVLTKDVIDDQLEIAWTNGARPTTLYVTSNQKRVINALPGAERTMSEQETMLKGLVDVYQSDWTTLKIRLDRRLAAETMYALNDDLFKIGVLRGIESSELPKTHSGYRGALEGEMTLICHNPDGNAGWLAVTDS